MEGMRLVHEAILAQAQVDEAYYTQAFAASEDGRAVLDDLSRLNATLVAVDESVMASMSDTQTPQGILCVLPIPRLEPPQDFSFALVVDRVADPGNLGTIMRAAAAAGVPLMIATSGTVDYTNPKVVRGAMGAHFRLPVERLSWEGAVSRLSGRAIFLADVRGGVPYYRVDWTQPCALVIGSEAHGPDEDALRLVHARVTIPMPGGMESLNVAMAASIFVFEMVRQRSKRAG